MSKNFTAQMKYSGAVAAEFSGLGRYVTGRLS
jgi:hypothetical protein